MKNKQFLLAFICAIVVFSADALLEKKNNTKDKTTTTIAIFDGYDADDGYAFIVKADDEDDDSEETMYFSEISEEAIKAINLKSKDMVGKRFEITYAITEYEEEDGYKETYEIYKILKIKKL
ncbi:MAG: hypothetical protein AB8B52_01900 [Winogradskyella sp.]|uniref:hypothetical protein n=1 Tax=Winogradskyella sp. TaxID=1883156 RepID=UPI0038599C6C